MKKRVIATSMAVLMAFGLAACGKSSDTSETSGTAASGETTTAASEEEEPYNIVMQVMTWGTVPSGIDEIEAAINEIVEPEIGVTVTLSPVAAWDLQSESTLAITSGEKMDLICILPYGSGMDSIANYTSKNMLMNLNEVYAEYGTDIAANVDEKIMQLGYQGDNLYAIPVNGVVGVTPTFVARTDLLDELGITIDEDKIYSLDELEEMFAAYVEKYGSGHYAVASYGTYDLYNIFYPTDNLGTDDASGVLLDGGLTGNTTIVNKFATDEYKEFCLRMQDWYSAGYFSPDVVTISDGTTQTLAQGNYLGTFGGMTPGIGFETMKDNSGYDLTQIKIGESYTTSGIASMCLWAIPTTCENPEKTMEFLNLLYQERELGEDIDTILSVGLEGVDYNVEESVSGSKAIISYPEGLNASTVSWGFTAPIYGNQLTIPQFAPLTTEIYDEYASYNEAVLSEGSMSVAFGYVYNPENVTTQKAAVNSVISQYQPILTYGTVDAETVLPEFLSALEAAGINDVISDNQSQLDAWLAAQ